MKRILLHLIIIAALSANQAVGQKTSNDITKTLDKLYSRFINNYNDTSRIQINDSIILIIDSYAKSDSVFRHKFKNIKYLGQITSRDSMVKIITWNLVLTNGQSKYFCYFIKKQSSGKGNLIYPLSSIYKEAPISADTLYYENDWYGALYYEIRPYTVNGKKWWIMLGIDYGNPYISRKIIDVLSFTPGDSIVFGRKWFDAGPKVKFREVFEYASNGMMSLRFKSDSSIVFDHLVPFSPAQKDDRQYYGPDYSTDAYNLIKGIWSLIINVDARNVK